MDLVTFRFRIQIFQCSSTSGDRKGDGNTGESNKQQSDQNDRTSVLQVPWNEYVIKDWRQTSLKYVLIH
jgi:hypothetical protein